MSKGPKYHIYTAIVEFKVQAAKNDEDVIAMFLEQAVDNEFGLGSGKVKELHRGRHSSLFERK